MRKLALLALFVPLFIVSMTGLDLAHTGHPAVPILRQVLDAATAGWPHLLLALMGWTSGLGAFLALVLAMKWATTSPK